MSVGTDDDDRDLKRAMRLAGRLPPMEPRRRREIEANVRAEWRSSLASAAAPRRGVLRAPRIALAASLLLGLFTSVGVWVATRGPASPVLAARVELVQGAGAVLTGPGRWPLIEASRSAGAPDPIRGGERLTTDGVTAVLTRIGPSASLRLAPDGELEFLADDRVRLVRGRLYVDSGGAPADSLVIATALGDVRHVGTRYLVEADAEALRVSVREGSVRVTAGEARTEIADAGERLEVERNAAGVRRSTIAPDDAAWSWLAGIPTPIRIDGLSLTDFLRWYEAEAGRPVVAGDASTASIVERVRLRGDVSGLAPDAALDAVAATSGLAVVRDGRGGVTLRRLDSAP